jgi:RecA-family ATPase
MQPFMDWAREENICIVFLHHSRKNNDDSMKSSARGAGAFVDAARTVYQIDKIYTNKHTGVLDMDNAHMREFMLTKDNYGAIRLLNDFKVQREITPKKSARVVEVTYTDYVEPKIEMALL